MSAITNNSPRPRYYDEADGHPLNVARRGRFHDIEGGIAICGECAVDSIMKQGNGWNTNHSAAILNRHGFERDPMNWKTEDQDWCCVCDKDFLS